MTFLRAFFRNRGAAVGLAILLLVALMAATAPVVFPFSPWDMQGAPFAPPGEEGFWLGSDSLGRDVAADIAYGSYVSLLVGAVSTAASLALGVVLGALAGYAGEWVDDAIMRFTEFFQTVPSFILAVVLVAIFTPSITSIVVAIAIVSWPPVTRVVRAEFMTLRNREFVQAAEVLGRSRFAIVFREILPNALSPIIVLASLMVASAILLESALSFLGLGDPNLMSWGFMIGAGRSVIRLAWWMSVFPGLALFLTVLALNLVGEGLSDALNPRLARRR
ncbi:MAG: ABC transporter permease [Janthinobacterium lividum]